MNEFERRRVIKTLIDCGIDTVVELVQRTGLPKTTVRRVRNRILAGQPIARKVGSGGMRHLSPVAINVARDEVVNAWRHNRPITPAKVRRQVVEQTGEEVSVRTMRRTLKREEFICKKPRPGPLLNEHHRATRQTWCIVNEGDDFTRTAFIDEARFQLHRNTVLMWFPRHEERPRVGLPRHSPSLHCLGGIASTGVTPLVVQAGTWTADSFVAAISDHLEPMVSVLYDNDPDRRYMLDNAPCHTAAFTRQWAQANGVNLFFQPSASPDLQPMENVWALLKQRVEMRAPRTLQELRGGLEEEWASLTVDEVAPFWENMARRMNAVLTSGGSWTKY